MTDSEPTLDDGSGSEARRRRRERLYVALQTGGWLAFFGFNLVLAGLFADAESNRSGARVVVAVTQATMIAWLLSHLARAYVNRRGWKELGWAALVPRVLALSFVISVVWTFFGYGYQYQVLREAWPEHYPRPALALTGSVINGTIIFVGWFGLYFSYHAFSRYNVSEIERLRLAASVKDAELRALKAQVNPHFMFNALNSVRALIDEDPVRARRAVTQLANLLRYSLQSGALETVPFEDELQVVNDYLALEQVRHEERLRLRVDIAPNVLRQPFPPMLLQTLVENAVKYGISTRTQGGEVCIRARIVRDEFHLQVTNPGCLAVSGTGRAGSTGLGLRNAANRLRLLFGERATLTLRQDAADLVVAEALVPLQAEAPPTAPAAGRPIVSIP